MKANILVALLALLMVISVGGGVTPTLIKPTLQKTTTSDLTLKDTSDLGMTTDESSAEPIGPVLRRVLGSTATIGAVEQDGAEESTNFQHLYGTAIIGNSDERQLNRNEYGYGGQKPVERGWEDTGITRGNLRLWLPPGCMNATMCGQWLPDEISATQWGSNEQYAGEALPGPLLHQDTTPTYTDQSGMQLEYVSELAPSTIVYVGGTTIPLSSYQTKPGKYLWIESPNGLLEYASIPKSKDYYPSLSLMAYTSTAGPGEILEMFPSTSNQGTYIKTYYSFNPGYNRIPYRGDVSGRHYLQFSMGDQSSNAVIIDVDRGMIGDSPLILGTMPS